MVGEILCDEFYGIVLRKGEEGLMARVNSAIKILIENGTVTRLHQKWDLGQAAKVPK